MNIKILDCTLRDGGYVNQWEFGLATEGIISFLSQANIDYIELGFLRNGNFKENQSLYNDVAKICCIADRYDNQHFGLMIRPDWYDISQLTASASIVDFIRFAFYFKDRVLTEKYCSKVRNMGYTIAFNAVNICSYDDKLLEELIKFVNYMHPEIMTIVDTFGALTLESLKKYYSYIEEHLDKDITIGAHFHDNMLLSVGLAQTLLDIADKDRNIIIDSTLNGIGRLPGNLPTEILAEIINRYKGSSIYNNFPILKCISENILPIKERVNWGYSPAYYQSGMLAVHRSYAEFYLKDIELDLRDIAILLKTISERDEKWAFNEKYAIKVKDDYFKGNCI